MKNMKGLLSIVLMTAAVAAYAQQYDPESDFKTAPLGRGRSVMITEYVGSKQAVSIPPRIQGLPVTGIGDKAFQNKNLVSVTIPDRVESIGDSAFAFCTSLAVVTIPDGVESIGELAFYYCRSLTGITIPASVENIGIGAFYRCASLTAIDVAADNSAYAAEDGVLYNKSKTSLHTYPEGKTASSFAIPNSVVSIGDYAFSACASLTGVTIPNSVENIGDFAFFNCAGLVGVTIPNSVKRIGNKAFRYCSRLASVTIPNSVMGIGEWAFGHCTSLTGVTIGNGVVSIGQGAFVYCTGLASVTIGSGVVGISDLAFAYCASLASVTFQGEIAWRNLSTTAFEGDLRGKYLSGGKGTYTRPDGGDAWTKQ